MGAMAVYLMFSVDLFPPLFSQCSLFSGICYSLNADSCAFARDSAPIRACCVHSNSNQQPNNLSFLETPTTPMLVATSRLLMLPFIIMNT